MLDNEGDTHLYVQLADLIRLSIVDGRLSPGDPVPSEADLQDEFGIARTTARRAVKLLRDDGLVHTVQGLGTFVGLPGEAQRQARKTPRYRDIADALLDRIYQGDFKPRRPLPSESALTQQHDVARETVRRALAFLREQGWIYTVPQRGTYVSPPEKWPTQTEGRGSPGE